MNSKKQNVSSPLLLAAITLFLYSLLQDFWNRAVSSNSLYFLFKPTPASFPSEFPKTVFVESQFYNPLDKSLVNSYYPSTRPIIFLQVEPSPLPNFKKTSKLHKGIVVSSCHIGCPLIFLEVQTGSYWSAKHFQLDVLEIY